MKQTRIFEFIGYIYKFQPGLSTENDNSFTTKLTKVHEDLIQIIIGCFFPFGSAQGRLRGLNYGLQLDSCFRSNDNHPASRIDLSSLCRPGYPIEAPVCCPRVSR